MPHCLYNNNRMFQVRFPYLSSVTSSKKLQIHNANESITIVILATCYFESMTFFTPLLLLFNTSFINVSAEGFISRYPLEQSCHCHTPIFIKDSYRKDDSKHNEPMFLEGFSDAEFLNLWRLYCLLWQQNTRLLTLMTLELLKEPLLMVSECK